MLNFCFFNFIHCLNPCYHSEITVNIPKNVRKASAFEINMKMKMKMQNRSHRHDINRSKARHGHKYTKHERRCRMMMLY